MSVRHADPAVADAEQAAIETELVQLALRAAEHHPILKAVYMGPLEWLEQAQRDPAHRET